MDALAYVVILNWNGIEYIRGCLQSVLAQTYANYRVLVVDNASTDESAGIVRDEFPDVRLLALPENLHFARGSNAGFAEALRDPACAYVVALNNDTRVDPDWLAALTASAQEPGVGSVASKLLFMNRPRILNSTGIRIARDGGALDRGWDEVDEGQYDASADVFGPSAGAALYRREVLDTVGLFEADFVAYYEDVDLAWRARLAGWGARFAPRAVVYHKFSASTAPKAIWKTYQCERNRVWNLIQNYPWRLALSGVPWNAGRQGYAILARRFAGGSDQAVDRPDFGAVAGAAVRARLDAYAGLPRALRRRRSRRSYRKVDAATVGQWLRQYGVSWKGMFLG